MPMPTAMPAQSILCPSPSVPTLSLRLGRPKHLPVRRHHRPPPFFLASGQSGPKVALLSSPLLTTPAVPCTARHNEINVQHVSQSIYDQIFAPSRHLEPEPDAPASDAAARKAHLVELARDHLERHKLLGKNTDNSDPIGFELPPLHGTTMDEHFHKLGVDCAEPYLGLAKQFALSTLPPKPTKWIPQSGWHKYTRKSNGKENRPEKVEAPGDDEEMLCFDVEVLYKQNPFAIMACAASPTAWYVWLSPWLMGEDESEKQLIPLGNAAKPRIVVGHNIGYDRARILEEYDVNQTKNAFLDTMSLHVAVNGMCSQQRPKWMKHRKTQELRDRIAASDGSDLELAELLKSAAELEEDEEEELWIERSSINSLRDVAKFHLGTEMDKTVRNEFGELDRQGVRDKLAELLDYCAGDVAITHQVYRIVFDNFLGVCPHPVSFAALRHLSSVILPVNRSWDAYISNTESTYQKLLEGVHERLVGLANTALALKDNEEEWRADPWLRQLDWSGQEIRMTKGKKNEPPRPVARQKLPGMPKWYRDLFTASEGPKVTVRTRLAPLLLKLSWDGYPLFWTDKYGWTFRVPVTEAKPYLGGHMVQCDMSEDAAEALKWDIKGFYFKLPHKDGPTARCTSPLAKSYLAYFENGQLSSAYPYAKEALEMNASCSYWISARDRIMSQMVVFEGDIKKPNPNPKSEKEQETGGSAGDITTTPATPPELEQGFILPQLIPMGTITRRAVEKTWLTASNAKKNRVGSELKAMVKAPPGYSFVGADVDSEELWIASLVGDATFKLHGGNAIGFMTLEGTKAAGTDLHSRTADILGITRNNAKVFNYGRIYGAGLKFAATLLRQFNPALSERETADIAGKLYAATKGAKASKKALYPRPFWRGGTESFVFNKLEEFAEQERPRTPVLAAGITEALLSQYVSKGGYLTSRINWAIQSSGVDYLHLLVVSMDYLIRRFSIQARLAITVHDEIRYLVKNQDRYRIAMALQVANLWTRAMFAQQMGINDLPQSCAFFSAIDVDHVLRKEVDMDCITPSHLTPIPPGESLTIQDLLAKGKDALLDPTMNPDRSREIDLIEYTPRTPVMQQLERSRPDDADNLFIRAQIATTDAELRQIVKEIQRSKEAPRPKPTRQAPKRSTQNTYPPSYETDLFAGSLPSNGVVDVHDATRVPPKIRSSKTVFMIPKRRAEWNTDI